MGRIDRITTVFSAELPEVLDEGTLYVSEECRVALHNCACGCGEEVSTPLGPTEFTLALHGGRATMYPSIGNHDFACRSHYFIRNGGIVWSGRMSQADITAGRERDRLLKRPPIPLPNAEQPRKISFGRRILNWIRSFFG